MFKKQYFLFFISVFSCTEEPRDASPTGDCLSRSFDDVCPLNTSPRITSIAQDSCEEERVLREGEGSVTLLCISSGECHIDCEVNLSCDGNFVVTENAVTCVSQATAQDCSIVGIDFDALCPENTKPDLNTLSQNNCAIDSSDNAVCASTGQCSFSCVASCDEVGVQEIRGERVICNPEPSCGDGSCDGPEGRADSRFYCELDCRRDCMPTQTICEGDLLARCNQLSEWEEATPCPDEQVCRESNQIARCVTPMPEVCDNLDNDFDGRVDEELTREYERQTGICRGAVQRCVEGVWGEASAPNSSFFIQYYESEETSCDQMDNDCDGIIDNAPQGNSPFSLCCQDARCIGLDRSGEEWVTIPAGSFVMGSDDSELFTSAEAPPHEVTLSSFQMMKTEVTTEMYRACVASGNCPTPRAAIGSNFYPRDDQQDVQHLPMNRVSWVDAYQFCVWLGGDLPSEAQWEYAARRGGQTLFPWAGDLSSLTCEKAHTSECLSDPPQELPVCSKPDGDTLDGLCDMIGNVAEWVKDDVSSDYLNHPRDGSAYCVEGCEIPSSQVRKITRGGGARLSSELRMNTAIGRSQMYYSNQLNDAVGFRCIK